MPVLIVVGTPHKAFGELLRGSLEDSGHYKVHLVSSGKAVREAVTQARYALAILDSAMQDEPFVPLCENVLARQQGIRLVVIPPDNNPGHPSLGGLLPHGYLSRPFYLPDLMETVAQLVNQNGNGSYIPLHTAPAIPAWLQEPSTLRSYLQAELVKTDAQAGIVGMTGPGLAVGSVRAWAGQLDEDSAQELAAMVFRYWNRAEKTDLMRFMRLSTIKAEFLVYATLVTGDLVLVLAYETQIPLSQIRPQAKAIAQQIVSSPPDGQPPADSPNKKPTAPIWRAENTAGEKNRNRAAQEQASSLAEIRPVENNPGTAPLKPQAPQEESLDDNVFFGRVRSGFGSSADLNDISFDFDTPEEDEGPPVINLSALLGNVPDPDPDGQSSSRWSAEIPTQPPGGNGYNGWLRDSFGPDDHTIYKKDLLQEESEDLPVIELPAQMPAAPHASEESSLDPSSIEEEMRKMQAALAHAAQAENQSTDQPASKRFNATPAAASTEDNQTPETGREKHGPIAKSSPEPVTQPVPVATELFSQPKSDQETALEQTRAIIHEQEHEIDALEETRPRLVMSLTRLDQLEPVSPAISLLNYTCVLIPRLPQHYLTGSLADLLSGWVAQLCIAFGWRLEGISIRPEYIQWTVQVAPSVSPGNLVKIIRQRTSVHIFNSFAHLREQNPSGDFWANGYLIVSGAQPPSPQLLRDFINQTRKRQGVGK